ncbi:TAXI family TRAP transporter solute-binding subunit [Marinomonas vulgaris]|nr:TAXI family TRAP transporter solute-binding subunit [Marinomonas vulgaris]
MLLHSWLLSKLKKQKQKEKIMFSTIKKGMAGTLVSAVLMLSPIAHSESYEMTIAGASPGGLWSLLGAGVDGAVRESYEGSKITYQTSGGGVANVGLLDRDQANLAIIHDAELLLAKKGDDPFREPIDSARVLSYLYTWAPMQALISNSFAEEYGIKAFEDIAKVKPPITIAINKRGNIASNIAVEMLEAIGVTEADIESWGGKIIYAASGEQISLIQDRRADLLINSLFVKHSSIMQAANSVDLTLLSMEEGTVDAINAESGTVSFDIPAGTYEFSPNAVHTASLGATLAVREDMDEELAYNLTKALFENYETIVSVHSAMKALTPEIMASVTVVPYHKGALKYLEEVGLK